MTELTQTPHKRRADAADLAEGTGAGAFAAPHGQPEDAALLDLDLRVAAARMNA